jgi:hypothetical protein
MKKGFLLLIAIFTIAIMAYGMVGTEAWFTDTVTTSSMTISSGTLSLKINGQNDVSQTYGVSNLIPGAWDLAGQAILKNDGSIKGHLWLEIINVRNFENTCINPETNAGDATCGSGPDQGELGSFAKIIFQANVAPWTRYGGTKTITAASGQRVDLIDLEPGQSYPVVAYVSWPPTDSDNLAMGDSVVFDVVFHLDQIH